MVAFRELGPLAFEDGVPPGGTIRICRAVGPQGIVRGMAWTTDPTKLSIFIRRPYLKQSGSGALRPSRVYAATIDGDCIVATCRFESEIVINPECLSDVRLLRLDAPDGKDWVASGQDA